MNKAPNTPHTWRKHILIPGDKLYRGQKSVGRNQRQMETFATADIVKNCVEMRSIVSREEGCCWREVNFKWRIVTLQF